MNTDIRKKVKSDFEKDFLNLSQQKEEETIWRQN